MADHRIGLGGLEKQKESFCVDTPNRLRSGRTHWVWDMKDRSTHASV